MSSYMHDSDKFTDNDNIHDSGSFSSCSRSKKTREPEMNIRHLWFSQFKDIARDYKKRQGHSLLTTVCGFFLVELSPPSSTSFFS